MFLAKPEDGVVWVTGASSGIGKSLALLYSSKGYKVVTTARRETLLKELGLPYYVGDVTDRDQIKTIITKIEAEHGPIALAILNAGTQHRTSKSKLWDDSYRKTLDVNINGTINCLETLVPIMCKRKQGQIAVMSSVAGFAGLPNFGADYTSSKAMLINMCESMQYQLVRKGIHMQVICPAFVDTGLIQTFGVERIKSLFLLSEQNAAQRIYAGLCSSRFCIAFPKRITWLLKLRHFIPYRLQFALTKIFFKMGLSFNSKVR